MAETTTPGSGAGEEQRDPEQIETEIEETREELADTVAAVADKTDVKKQARLKLEETKTSARESATAARERTLGVARDNRAAIGIAGAVVVAAALVWILRR